LPAVAFHCPDCAKRVRVGRPFNLSLGHRTKRSVGRRADALRLLRGQSPCEQRHFRVLTAVEAPSA
jgi:hypothetical protein